MAGAEIYFPTYGEKRARFSMPCPDREFVFNLKSKRQEIRKRAAVWRGQQQQAHLNRNLRKRRLRHPRDLLGQARIVRGEEVHLKEAGCVSWPAQLEIGGGRQMELPTTGFCPRIHNTHRTQQSACWLQPCRAAQEEG